MRLTGNPPINRRRGWLTFSDGVSTVWAACVRLNRWAHFRTTMWRPFPPHLGGRFFLDVSGRLTEASVSVRYTEERRTAAKTEVRSSKVEDCKRM
jgi:hypothetical protein